MVIVWRGCLTLEAIVLALLRHFGRVEATVGWGGGDRVGLGHLACRVGELLLEGQLLRGTWF